jgi:hypothetical protein
LLTSKRTFRHILSSSCVLFCASTAFAAAITGTVTNRTTGKPSVGDTVAIIDTAKSMDEIGKVTTDSQGTFHVATPDGGQILLHITHAGAEYFKTVTPGTSSVDVDVYDSARKIDGITGEALVLRAETDSTGKTLSVTENFFVQNTSSPPRTEYGGNTFDFYLPKGAVVEMSLASSPGGLPTNTKVVPIDAASGHYAFTFPVRPGESRFQVAYTLPYTGKLPISIKLSVPTGDFAVMLPKTMQFDGGTAFQPISPDPNTQSYDAHRPAIGQPVQFTLAGTGQLPDESSAQPSGGQSAGGGQSSQTATGGSRPGGGLGAPEDPEGTNDPWAKYKGWILGGLGLILAAGAGIMLKNSPKTEVAGTVPSAIDAPAPTATEYAAAPAPVPGATPPLLQALKDELLELETDRLSGKLSPAEYAEHKAAFDIVLRRALNRTDVS